MESFQTRTYSLIIPLWKFTTNQKQYDDVYVFNEIRESMVETGNEWDIGKSVKYLCIHICKNKYSTDSKIKHTDSLTIHESILSNKSKTIR